MTEVKTMPDTHNLHSAAEMQKTCEQLREAIDTGKIGDIVAKHEKLILHYYEDVQDQAKQSFSPQSPWRKQDSSY
jgi:hypothetical protein